ncbi:hypothetical protein PR202_gb00059 [Eleusine coracana subsp. coracana]|uniref:Uncharacterized protein n=1 Tax=Eleusine coracana subsp. coracana TaxID=191504 RepID=A0AAV5DT41_ELECO|nr:hypothetical protein PR202_gb00059 [Eleusine coracana subsp. coracana]
MTPSCSIDWSTSRPIWLDVEITTTTATTSPVRALTQISCVPTHPPSCVPESHWTLTTGCVRPSLNSVCWNALSAKRCCSPPNNSRALLVPGGPTIKILCPLDASWNGMTSKLLSVLISSPLVSCKESSRNLWI